VPENPLSFCLSPTLHVKISRQDSGCRLVNKLEGTELGSVVGLIRAKHREQSVQEFTHSYDRLQTCFASTEQALVESPQMRLSAQGHQRWHVQSATQMTAAARLIRGRFSTEVPELK